MTPPPLPDAELVAGLARGDEAAFAHVLDRYHSGMLRVARGYVATREAAEDVVQETLLGVIRGVGSFEGRSSFATWMFRILVNRARSRGAREGRTTPFASVDAGGPTVDPERFERDGRWAGFWSRPPTHREVPEAAVLAAEIGDRLRAAIDALPANQRAVIELRDVQGLSAAEVCELLELTEVHQRVLLHRARAKVREMVEDYLT